MSRSTKSFLLPGSACVLIGLAMGLFVRELAAPSRGQQQGSAAPLPQGHHKLLADSNAAYDPNWKSCRRDRRLRQAAPLQAFRSIGITRTISMVSCIRVKRKWRTGP